MKTNIPSTMQAVVLTGPGTQPTVANIPVPQPGHGEVLIKMHTSPINPSDLAFLADGYGIKKPFPVVPGFEGSGIVVAAGNGILPKLWLGKKVACAASPKLNGCWAEYMVTTASSCVPLSKKILMEQGSMMFVNPMTALAFFDVYKNTPNPTKQLRGIINTAAASALGKMVIQLGKQKGIPVISVVRRKEQVDMLKSIGVEYVVNSSDPDFEIKLKELAHQLNATILFDAVGGKSPQQLLSAAPKGSKLFIYGRLSADACEILPGDLIFTGNKIQGFWLTNWLHEKGMIKTLLTIRKVQSLLNHELGTNIHQQFPPEKILEAIDTYKNNMSIGKVLIRF
ncbi:MAG TPA: zinc-binding dehydrogenase [Draconibacterium sp.]|nr:zinc-binding dehydrogenase [Draconibacterium sp.]